MPFGLIIVLLILFSKVLWIFAIAFKLLWIQVACTNRQIPAVAHLICQCTNTYTLIHKSRALSTLLQAFHICACTVFLIIPAPNMLCRDTVNWSDIRMLIFFLLYPIGEDLKQGVRLFIFIYVEVK